MAPIEHPDRRKFREAINKRNGTPYIWGAADCSQQIIDMCKGVGITLPFKDRNTQGMYDDAVKANRPVAKVLGALYLYGTSPSNISHVRLAYDDVVAFGAEGGGTGTKTTAQAKAQCAFWRSCDPQVDRRKVYGPFVPDWYPWYRVTTASLNLRNAYGLQGPVNAVLPPNTVLTLRSETYAESDGYTWVPVETPDGEKGWVALEFTKR